MTKQGSCQPSLTLLHVLCCVQLWQFLVFLLTLHVSLVLLCPPPTESDSDHSLSGFETVASHSFDSDEDEGSVTLSIPYHSASSMFQEDHHGDGDEDQSDGTTKHRSGTQQPSAFINVAPRLWFSFTSDQTMNSCNKGAASTFTTFFWSVFFLFA